MAGSRDAGDDPSFNRIEFVINKRKVKSQKGEVKGGEEIVRYK